MFSSSRSTQETKRDSEKDQRKASSTPTEQPPSGLVKGRGGSPRISPAPTPASEVPLIQAPPRSKWEREDDEEGQENGIAAPKEPSPVPKRSRGREGQTEAPKVVRSEATGDERRGGGGVVREEKKVRTPREEGKGGRPAQSNSDKPTKTKVVREERRGVGEEGRAGAREEGRGVPRKEERAAEGRGGGGREETRGPEPRRQRLCSDLGRETDEAAFVPDYSEGEVSETERGKSSPSPSNSQHSFSPNQSNHSDSAATADKKKKKHKKQKHKHKKHKKHKSQDKEAEPKEHKEHKRKHKKRKNKKNKDKDVEEKTEKDEGEEGGATLTGAVLA